MAAGSLPETVLLEDLVDLVDFLEFAGRTIPRYSWAEEMIALSNQKSLDSLF